MFGRPLYCVSLNDDMLLYPCDTISSPSPTAKCHSSRIHCIYVSRCFIWSYCSLSLLDHLQLLLDLPFQLLFQSFLCGRHFPSSTCTSSPTRFLSQVPHTKAQFAIVLFQSFLHAHSFMQMQKYIRSQKHVRPEITLQLH